MRILILLLILGTAVAISRAEAKTYEPAIKIEVKTECVYRANIMAHLQSSHLAGVPLWRVLSTELARNSKWVSDVAEDVYDGAFVGMSPQAVYNIAYPACMEVKSKGDPE